MTTLDEQAASRMTSGIEQVADALTAYDRLGKLSPAEYDRVRKKEAKTLGIRITTLDDEVAKYRPKSNRVHGREAAKEGVDSASHYTPSDNRATAQPPPPNAPSNPPEAAFYKDILAEFRKAVRLHGVVGEETTAATVYLLITSRLLEKPVSGIVKGHTSSGKSFTVERTVDFFPPEAVVKISGMSEHALIYSTEDYQHRTLIICEATALREGVEDNQTAYFVRTLLSEGRIDYDVTVRDKDSGGFTTKRIRKEGPTNMIITTTSTKVHQENETRLLSLQTDDTRDQTSRVFCALADESEKAIDFERWHDLQVWLQHANHDVTIPYATQLAELVPPVAVRLRRDFGNLLSLIRAHAILHQCTREQNDEGKIIATVEDYAAVRELIAGIISESVGSTVSGFVRETVEAVGKLAGDDGVMARDIAKHLDVDKSTASRRLRMAADGGYIQNLEDKRGKPGRWTIGDPLPEATDLLPQPRNLCTAETPANTGGCTVARDPGGCIDQAGEDYRRAKWGES